MHNLYILSPNRDSVTVNLSTMCITAVLDTLAECHGGIMTPGDFGDASPRGFGSGGRTVRALRSCDLTVAITLRTIAVFATHYLEEAQNFARRIVMLDRGGTIADGTLRGTRGQRPRPHLDRGGRHTHRHRRGRRGVPRDGP